jgi:hypothetical protein
MCNPLRSACVGHLAADTVRAGTGVKRAMGGTGKRVGLSRSVCRSSGRARATDATQLQAAGASDEADAGQTMAVSSPEYMQARAFRHTPLEHKPSPLCGAY